MEQPLVQSVPKVYFTKSIKPAKLIELYEKVGRKLTGNIAVKVHSGEHDKGYNIQPNFMKSLVSHVNGTIVECNAAYPGKRKESKDHWELIKRHGFPDVGKFDLMD